MRMIAKAFVFNVAIIGAPEIWRRIQIRADHTLDDLHDAIYRAFDRQDDHMFSFYLTKPGSRGRAGLRDATEYSHPYVVDDAPKMGIEPPLCVLDAILSDLGLKARRKFYYLWDFGDEWWHTVTVEQVLDALPRGPKMVILEKHGKSPDEFNESPPGRP